MRLRCGSVLRRTKNELTLQGLRLRELPPAATSSRTFQARSKLLSKWNELAARASRTECREYFRAAAGALSERRLGRVLHQNMGTDERAGARGTSPPRQV